MSGVGEFLCLDFTTQLYAEAKAAEKGRVTGLR